MASSLIKSPFGATLNFSVLNFASWPVAVKHQGKFWQAWVEQEAPVLAAQVQLLPTETALRINGPVEQVSKLKQLLEGAAITPQATATQAKFVSAE